MAEAEGASAREDDGVSPTGELARTRGFGVEARSGRIGRVAAVVPPRASGGAGVLLVHTGGRSCALASVPFEDVAAVDVDSCRVVLADRPSGTDEPELGPLSLDQQKAVRRMGSATDAGSGVSYDDGGRRKGGVSWLR